jgi:MATE family multidrug resistance protein
LPGGPAAGTLPFAARSVLLPTRQEFRTLVRLAVPVVAVQLGLMLMGVVDTVMVGRLSAEALGAVALGNLFFFTIAIIGMGTLMALDPVVAQAVGAGDEPAIGRGLQRGVLLAVLVSLPTMLGLMLVAPALRLMGQPAELIPAASSYIYAIIPGILPFFIFIAFRQTLQAMGRIAPIVWVIVFANLLNLVLNWALIYGKLGAPALGVTGAAIATSLSRFALAAGLLYAGRQALMPRLRPWRPEASDPAALGRMLRIGLPIGAQMFFEYGIFALVGALMGRIGTIAVGGHQIALNLSAIVFMIPQGVGAAAAVLVGQAVGGEDLPGARRAALGAVLLGAGFMVGAAVLFLLIPGPLARLYSTDQRVIAIAMTLIVLGGLFAVFDGLQAVCIGILRGIGDTRGPVAISMVGYWVIGMPVSLLLGFRLGQGPPGLWWGLVLGLAVNAVVLLIRVRSRLHRQLRRILIDHAPVPKGL